MSDLIHKVTARLNAFLASVHGRFQGICKEGEDLGLTREDILGELGKSANAASQPSPPTPPNSNGALRTQTRVEPRAAGSVPGTKKYTYTELAPFVSKAVLALVESGKQSFTTRDVANRVEASVGKDTYDSRHVGHLIIRSFKGLKVIAPGRLHGTPGMRTYKLMKSFAEKRPSSPVSGKQAKASKGRVGGGNYTYSDLRPFVWAAMKSLLKARVAEFTSDDLKAAVAVLVGKKAHYSPGWATTCLGDQTYGVVGFGLEKGKIDGGSFAKKNRYRIVKPAALEKRLDDLLGRFPLASHPEAAKTPSKAPGRKRSRSLTETILSCFASGSQLGVAQIQQILQKSGVPKKSIRTVGTLVPNLADPKKNKNGPPRLVRVAKGVYALAAPVSTPAPGPATTAEASTEAESSAPAMPAEANGPPVAPSEVPAESLQA